MLFFQTKVVAIILSLVTLAIAYQKTLTYVNNCPYTVWPASNNVAINPADSGFQLPPRTAKTIGVFPYVRSGRTWGRTGCTQSGGYLFCETGDCGRLMCQGSSSKVSTLVELSGGEGSMIFVNLSLVDGYNIDIAFDGVDRFGQFAWTPMVCNANHPEARALVQAAGGVDGFCPNHLKLPFNPQAPDAAYFYNGDARNGGLPWLSRCMSMCEATGRPEHCCTGFYQQRGYCGPSMEANRFKLVCPAAYSYAHDDPSSIIRGHPDSAWDFQLTFCPSQPSNFVHLRPAIRPGMFNEVYPNPQPWLVQQQRSVKQQQPKPVQQQRSVKQQPKPVQQQQEVPAHAETVVEVQEANTEAETVPAGTNPSSGSAKVKTGLTVTICAVAIAAIHQLIL